jgi:Kef-type K+ transport system membrane component KefB
VFFAYTGLRTDVGSFGGWSGFLVCHGDLAVAMGGKFFGAYLAARLVGEGRRSAATIGVCMNTRALMELIVLNIGYDLGVLPRSIFTMLVIMALVTTFLTTPLLRLMREGFESRRSARFEPEPLLRATADPANHPS